MGLCRLFHSLGCHTRATSRQIGWRAGSRWLIPLLLFSAAGPLASPGTDPAYQELSELGKQVKQYLKEHYQVADIERAEISVGRLDQRLRLKACQAPLEMSVSDDERSGGNLTVHTRCPGPTAWALYVPAQVSVYREVTVASRSLGRGHRLTRKDVSLALRDTGQLRQGFVTDLASAVGMELRRPLKAGEPVNLGRLTEPTVVERGDQVRLRAETGTISVNTMGTALGSGRVGDQVRVRNDSSERVVRARVTGPGTVEVIL